MITVTMTLPNGTRKYYRGKTRKEAEAKRKRDAQLIEKGIDLTENPTFQSVAKMWFYLEKDNNDLHIRTKETILGILDRYIYPELGDKPIREISSIDVRLLMKSVEKKSNSTQRKVLQTTRAIFVFAVENNYIEKSPVPDKLKAGGAVPEEVEALTDEQCRQLLSAVKGTRAYLFVETLLYTGLRKGEALGLMWKDIDFGKGVLRVERSVVYPLNNKAGEINPELKTSAARRSIPIVPELMADLQAAKKASRSVYVFSARDGSFLSESSFRRMWDLISYRSTETEGDKTRIARTLDFSVHPHQLRHTCITRWIENGLTVKEAQYLAGHATPDVTMGIYSHYRKDQMFSETAAKMGAVSGQIAAQG